MIRPTEAQARDGPYRIWLQLLRWHCWGVSTYLSLAGRERIQCMEEGLMYGRERISFDSKAPVYLRVGRDRME